MADQSRTIVLWVAAILLPATFYFCASADLPHVLIITCMLLILSAVKKTGWRVSDRSVVYLTILAMFITMFGNYMVPMKLERFGFMSIFSRPNLTLPFFLYMGALSAGFRRRSHAIGIAAAAAVLTFGFAGDIRFERLVSERMPFFNPLLERFTWFYGSTMVLSLLAILFGSRSGSGRGSFRRLLMVYTSLALVGGLIALEFWAYKKNENLFRNLENSLLRIGIRQLYRHTGSSMMQLGATPNLMQKMSLEFLGMSDRVALRAVGATPPGYLRGRSFHRYERGSWSSIEEALGTPLPTAVAEGTMNADQLYSVLRMEKTPYFWNLYPDETLFGNLLTAPGDVVSLELIATRVLRFRDGRIETEQFVREGGYTVYADSPSEESAMQQPISPKADLLGLPDELLPTLDEIADQLKLRNFPTDAERFLALEEFFRNEFTYALDWPGPRPEIVRGNALPRRKRRPEEEGIRGFEHRTGMRMGMRTAGYLAGGNPASDRAGGRFRQRWRPGDPVKFFLTEHRRAHCELYASATVLLLRAAGVPARYVTGIICNELHPSGRYYISRYGNAHAWVEAFDRQNKKWVLVDTTPPSITTPPTRPDTWQERLTSRSDFLQLSWQEILSDLRRGRFADGAMSIMMLAWRWMLYVVTHPLWGSLLGLCLLLAGYLFYRHRKRRPSDFLTPRRRKLQKRYRKLVRKLRRKRIVPRGMMPTALELLTIVENHPKLPMPRRLELARKLNIYLIERYSVDD